MSPEPMPLNIWLTLSTIIIISYLLTLLLTKNVKPRYSQTNLQNSTQNSIEEIENQELNNTQKLEEEVIGEEKKDLDILEEKKESTSTGKKMEEAEKIGEDMLKEILKELEETRRETSEPEIMIQLIDVDSGENKFKKLSPLEDLENLRRELSTLKRILKRENQ